MFDGFDSMHVDIGDTRLFLRRKGRGRPLLLLHGFPQTHMMWHAVAAQLAERYTVVCADLPGYGRSGMLQSYSKRAMADAFARMMQKIGFEHFFVAGHDRGARVAYRAALDHPDRIEALAVLDIVPTGEAFARADARLTLGFWPWSLLAQNEPLPERLITGDPEAVVDSALQHWGTAPSHVHPDARVAYVETLRHPDRVHAICEEFRASATVDYELDLADAKVAKKIGCPTLVLWASDGPVDTWYAEAGGALGIWRSWAQQCEGEAVEGGHFFPESNPEQTVALLTRFFG